MDGHFKRYRNDCTVVRAVCFASRQTLLLASHSPYVPASLCGDKPVPSQVVRGLPVADLQLLLDGLGIVSQTPPGSNGSACFLNFNSSTEAQAAASKLHNYPSPIDSSGCLWAVVKGSLGQANGSPASQQGLFLCYMLCILTGRPLSNGPAM